MAPKLEQQTPAERQSSLANADNSMATVAREFNDPKTAPQQRSQDITALNHTLETTGVLPGMTITDMHSTKPGDADAPESVKIETTDPKTGGQVVGEAQYDPQNHQLTYERTGVLPGTKQGEHEHVTVDMTTGRETVTAPGENGTTRTTTRESVGASDPTTVVTANVNGKTEVVQTEATNKNGDTAVTQYHYDNNGKLTSYTPPGGQDTNVPEGSTVDAKTGVLFATKPDGTKIDVTPQGRIFTIDPTGKTSYNVQPGDTLTDVARDLAKVQGNPTPSDNDVQNIVSQIGHAGVNGDPNAIRAGDTINFGAGTADGDNVNLTQAKPSDVAPPPAEKPPQGIPQDAAPVGEPGPQGQKHYKKDNVDYTSWPSGLVETTKPVENGSGSHKTHGTETTYTINGQQVSIPEGVKPDQIGSLTFENDNGTTVTKKDGKAVAWTKGNEEVVLQSDNQYKYHTFGSHTYVGLNQFSFNNGRVTSESEDLVMHHSHDFGGTPEAPKPEEPHDAPLT